MNWKTENEIIVPDRRVCDFGLGLNLGLGAQQQAAAAGSSGPSLIIAASDTYAGHSDGSIHGATLNNALGGSGTRTWGALVLSNHAISYDTDGFTFTNPGNWNGAYVNDYATTGAKVGMKITGFAPVSSGKCAFLLRTRTDIGYSVRLYMAEGSTPYLELNNGSSNDFGHAMSGLDAISTTPTDLEFYLEDTGADSINFHVKYGSKSDTYQIASGASAYIGSAQAWKAGLRNYASAPDCHFLGFAVGTHEATL